MFARILFTAFTAAALAACGQQSEAQQAASAPVVEPADTSSDLAERIAAKGTVTVGTEGTYAPFTYHDKDGKLTGYDVEVTRAVAAKLGVTVEFKETQWDAMLAGLKSGRFDMVANQVALTTPERQATFDKAEPYNWSGPMMLGRQDEKRVSKLEDIKGLKAAQTLSSNYGEMAAKAKAEIVAVEGMAQALAVVQQGRADVTLNDSLALLDFMKKTPESGLKIVWQAGAEDKVGAGLVLNKGNDAALEKINQAMKELHADGTLKKLSEEFFGTDVSVK